MLSIVLLTTACSKEYIEKVLSDNPEILADVIEKNPKLILDAINKASIQYRQEQVKLAEEQRRKKKEEARKNPKKPKMGEKRAYFGDKDAPITVVKYSDFQCGFCDKARRESVSKILTDYKGKVRVLYKHLPLDFHPQAMIAAQYYEAVVKTDKSKAKAFHDKLFENYRSLGEGKKILDKFVTEVGLKPKDIHDQLDEVKPIIEEDMAEAKKFGFNGTPGFLVAGVPLSGAQPFEEFKKEIDIKLKEIKN